jgi:hypothetical protein
MPKLRFISSLSRPSLLLACFHDNGMLRLNLAAVRKPGIYMNRPPPYFPQNQLSPPDEKRYRKFKLIVGLLAAVLILIVAGAAYGIYYLVSSLL